MKIPEPLQRLAGEVEASLVGAFVHVEETARHNTQRVLEQFSHYRLSDSHFAGTTGYGYDDTGRELLDKVFAALMGCEGALVRTGFVNGTHAIACALRGALRSGQILVSAVGTPYDTLQNVIEGDAPGAFPELGISHRVVSVRMDGTPDLTAITEAAQGPQVGAVLIQRSRGYTSRPALSVAQIQEIIAAVRAVNPKATCVVDNCYGEFVERREPGCAGADLVAGSLIKNPGGGLAPTGGYIAGKQALVERCAAFLTAPGIGGHCGATLGQNRALLQGLFFAPHVVCQALKTAIFCAGMLERLGYQTAPAAQERRSDIIQTVHFGAPGPLLRFCRGIQEGSPVDAFAVPEPWPMPGYDCDVVMAAGTFVQGGSLELSCDAPMRPPYTAYVQGGLTYEAGRWGILHGLAQVGSESP